MSHDRRRDRHARWTSRAQAFSGEEIREIIANKTEKKRLKKDIWRKTSRCAYGRNQTERRNNKFYTCIAGKHGSQVTAIRQAAKELQLRDRKTFTFRECVFQFPLIQEVFLLRAPSIFVFFSFYLFFFFNIARGRHSPNDLAWENARQLTRVKRNEANGGWKKEWEVIV